MRFERSPTARERAAWKAAGIELGRALGGGAYFARVAAAVDGDALARLGGLADVREVELAWKLHPELLAGRTPPWTIVPDGAEGDARVGVYVLLQAGAALERGGALLAEHGGSLVDVLESVHGLVALLPRERVNGFAAEDEVQWIEPALPRMEGFALPVNDSNRARTGADVLQAPPYGLDGSGVSVLVFDAEGARETHVDFGGRLTVGDGTAGGGHATHVAATIGGNGAASGGLYRGMAPGVTIESFAAANPMGYYLFDNPADLESDYASALALGAVLSNNSLGAPMEALYPCELQGDYAVTSSLVDAIVRGSLGVPVCVFWAQGNERSGSRCDVEGFGDYYSTTPPGTAKNPIAVGALNSNDDSMTSFSSFGPTDDGRLKPDVCAPGCQSNDDGGVTSAHAFSDTDMRSWCGTSMASPTACGVAALLLEDYRVQFGAPDPLNSTLKVLLAHTAVDLGNPGPDHRFGYGSVRARAAVDFQRLGRFVERTLEDTGDRLGWTVDVAPNSPELRLTLAWDDAAAAPNVLAALVNDLDLVVRDPLGARHHVWTLDPLAPEAPAVRRAPNRRDNLEQVLVAAPVAGAWTVEVQGFDVAEGPQRFSLASSHALVPRPGMRIAFPQGLPPFLEPGETVSILARITGENDALVAGSATLHVRYVPGLFLTLPMTALGADLFTATLPAPACAASPEFFVSVLGVETGLARSPAAGAYTALVGDLTTVFEDDFSVDRGWSVVNVALTAGAWERGVPLGGYNGDPALAFGGSGACYTTENAAASNADVDGGPTRLVSPLLDLGGGGAHFLSYARWFTSNDPDSDRLAVELSNDGGASWTLVDTMAGDAPVWRQVTLRVEDFLPPASTLRVRFSVKDAPSDSRTEAAIDSVRLVRRSCAPLADCNGNGIVDADDIASGRALDVDADGIPDGCDDPTHGKRRWSPAAPSSAAAR